MQPVILLCKYAGHPERQFAAIELGFGHKGVYTRKGLLKAPFGGEQHGCRRFIIRLHIEPTFARTENHACQQRDDRVFEKIFYRFHIL
ncbi:hypothetical protein SDC9_173715 [bioreactor metagenome]|uniref:Uncharacterized protein n=1 Tax=bioreactor metagenome TaxID=1076179 RepID=A0A645GH51_9ZZZZ